MENIDWKDLLFGFNGRINRGKYWAGYGAIVALGIVVVILATIVVAANSGALALIVMIIVVAFAVAQIWVGLAISIKRWHDRGKSGWWILIGLIPIVGPIWALVETGFLKGDEGDNQYGPNPLAS